MKDAKGPTFISTWNFGLTANEAARKELEQNGNLLTAVESGIRTIEGDSEISSVGLGGAPDRYGHVTLDASIMDHRGNAGSVAALEQIMHPISVARSVMEKTPHVMLAGEGALQFALEQGFVRHKLLTKRAETEYREWLKEHNYNPNIDGKHHDTIGLIGMDGNGNLSGGCSTSGLAYKMRGRVGDSPIIGAGLYVDNDVGGATATGLGETVMKNLGYRAPSSIDRERWKAEADEETLVVEEAGQVLYRLNGSSKGNSFHH